MVAMNGRNVWTRMNLEMNGKKHGEYVEIVVLIGTSSIWKLQFRIDFRHLINP